MDIDKYLEFVASKIREAAAKEDLKEAKRLLNLCAETCLEKADEIEVKE